MHPAHPPVNQEQMAPWLTPPARDRICPYREAVRDQVCSRYHRVPPSSLRRKRGMDCNLDPVDETPRALLSAKPNTSVCDMPPNGSVANRPGSPALQNPAPA